MWFVFIWEQTATCATYSINWLVFITEMKSVYSAARTGSLNKAVCASPIIGTVIKHFLFPWKEEKPLFSGSWDFLNAAHYISPIQLNETCEHAISSYLHKSAGIKNDALYCAVCTHSLGCYDSATHCRCHGDRYCTVIWKFYWTRRHYWLVTCQCVGTDWFADRFRAGKIKFLILFVFMRSILVSGILDITPGLLLLTQNSGTR